MTTRFRIMSVIVAALAGCQATRGGSAEPEAPKLPPPARTRVDFETQIRPILQARCLKCHARGKYKGGLSMETRAAVLKGGEGGPSVVVGKSGESLLLELVAGVDPDRRMPEKGDPLTAEQVGLLRAWIDQGLAWPEGRSFGFPRANIAPRTPRVPDAPGGLSLGNPVDRFVARDAGGDGKEKGDALDWTPAADRVFARRVSLDLTGLLPSPESLDAFEKDRRADKDARLVAALLADRRAYADHWLTFWNDALRNAYRGTGFIDGGRKTITQWLYRSLYDNTRYDRFVHDLVDPVPGAEGFTKGIVWRGVVNASQAPPVQAAQNVSQVFLGTNLKCASCHDSFVNHWKLTDAYGLASVFADKPLELHRCDKPTGQTSSIGFIYPQLGTIDAKAPRGERMKQLADILVKPENGRFARTIVNRLWAHLMGRGLVEPLDDMDQAAWSQDLLDWLAADLVAHGYDLKHTLAQIATSRAYRLPAVGVAEPSERGPYRFRGPFTKRMTAEQFADAVSTLTGVWPKPTGEMAKVDTRGQGGQVDAVRAALASGKAETPHVEAHWVWSRPDFERDPGGTVYFRKVIHLDALPARALAVSTCDNEHVLYVNGRKVAEGSEWSRPVTTDLTKLLKVGDNVIAAEATNWPDATRNRGTQVKGPNAGAFIAWVGGFQGDRAVWGFGTDASWLRSAEAGRAWKDPGYDTKQWEHAVELPDAGRIYGAAGDLAAFVGTSPASPVSPTVRASLAFEDPLLAALGRTNREQVVTRRDSVATTLQALELTNGVTLDATLKKGAGRWVEGRGREPDPLVRQLFLTAFGREPVARERATARELVGSPPDPDGVQDLLWSLLMLPEFQLIP